ncbi:MAG: type I restriction endonuclease subunit M [Pirellulaceae bacterium]|nr:type I restriction endonuclease subunit M [Pirellulaceae bacterium]
MSVEREDRLLELEMGQLCITRSVMKRVLPVEVEYALDRHRVGDWGLVCDKDKVANWHALILGLRILSLYRASNGTEFWIITEADRSVTTILLPEES